MNANTLECHPERGPARERIKPALGLAGWDGSRDLVFTLFSVIAECGDSIDADDDQEWWQQEQINKHLNEMDPSHRQRIEKLKRGPFVVRWLDISPCQAWPVQVGGQSRWIGWVS